MYIIYVDESGDTGINHSPTPYFILSGLVIHELRWMDCLDQLISFRQDMKAVFNLRMNEEIHASHFINKPGPVVRIKRNDRLSILRLYADKLTRLPSVNIVNVAVDKMNKNIDYDVFGNAWKALLQRIENTIAHRNFPGPTNPDERAMIFPDDTSGKKLKQLMRRIKRYNPIPNQPSFGIGYRDIPILNIIEDPSLRSSKFSYFIQAVDTTAYLLYQKLNPSSYMKKNGGNKYFDLLDPILCKVASRNDPQGIVYL